MWKKMYYHNKYEIRFYIAVVIVFSMFLFCSSFPVFANSSDEAVLALGGSVGGIFLPVMHSFLGGIDTSAALAFMSVFAWGAELLPGNTMTKIGLEGYSFGVMDIVAVRVLLISWFFISKLSRSCHITYVAGVSLENIESFLGGLVNLLIVGSQFMANFSAGVQSQAGVYKEVATASAKPVIGLLSGVMILGGGTLIYFLIRALFFCVDIILIPINSIIPFVGLLVETSKSVTVILLGVIAIFMPQIFIVVSLGILIFAVMMFPRAYATVFYFKYIYLTSSKKHKIIVTDKMIAMADIPGKIRKYANSKGARVIIPVFLLQKIPNVKETYRNQQWWLIIYDEQVQLYRTKSGIRGDRIISLSRESSQEIIIKKSFRFIEMYIFDNVKKGKYFSNGKVHKSISFICGREFHAHYDKLRELTAFREQ